MLELNKVYKMDNLELLNKLPNNYIDLIYCNILFNTGKKFKDYNDNLGTPQEAIEWYRPRILEMYRVLKDTGSIYLHMDYRLVHYMKVLMDEVFGFDCFLNDICWKRSTSTGGKTKSKMFPRNYDSILVYKKGKQWTYNKSYVPYTQDYIDKFYNHIDDNERRYSSQTLGDYSEESISKFEQEGRIILTRNGVKRLKYYLDEQKGLLIDDVWIDIKNVRQEQVKNIYKKDKNTKIEYDTQKPKALLERIIKASSNKGDIILDLFCGSGTTMVVAKELGRRYIGCDISERAIEITEKRLSDVDGKVSECVC